MRDSPPGILGDDGGDGEAVAAAGGGVEDTITSSSSSVDESEASSFKGEIGRDEETDRGAEEIIVVVAAAADADAERETDFDNGERGKAGTKTFAGEAAAQEGGVVAKGPATV